MIEHKTAIVPDQHRGHCLASIGVPVQPLSLRSSTGRLSIRNCHAQMLLHYLGEIEPSQLAPFYTHPCCSTVWVMCLQMVAPAVMTTAYHSTEAARPAQPASAAALAASAAAAPAGAAAAPAVAVAGSHDRASEMA